MYTWYAFGMEVPITQFRKQIFALADQAIDGQEVWFTHKGRRLRVIPEGKPASKLSRLTPLDVIPAGVDIDDDSWKEEMMREWEQNWDRQLAALEASPDEAAKTLKTRPKRRKA
jgi:hypothetical protein